MKRICACGKATDDDGMCWNPEHHAHTRYQTPKVYVSHQAGSVYAETLPAPHDLIEGTGVWKRGRVERFPRRLGAVRLVMRALVEALY